MELGEKTYESCWRCEPGAIGSSQTEITGNTHLVRTAPALKWLWFEGRQSSCETGILIDGEVKIGETWLFCLYWAELGAETWFSATQGQSPQAVWFTGRCREESAAREPFFTSLPRFTKGKLSSCAWLQPASVWQHLEEVCVFPSTPGLGFFFIL